MKHFHAAAMLLLMAALCPGVSGAAQDLAPAVSSSGEAALPDAPAAQTSASRMVGTSGVQRPPRGSSLKERFLNEVDPGYMRVGDKWDVTINKGEIVRPFSRIDKLHYALEEEKNPIVLLDAAWSAGYEQLRDADPHYGSDSAAYGERLGAAAFRQGTYRLFGDGIFPALTHEDPRYYRVATGGFWFRASRSLLQVVQSHRDDGGLGIGYSTLLGEAVSNTLPLTFYPRRSVRAEVAISGFATALADDGLLKLVREFLPDALGLGGEKR